MDYKKEWAQLIIFATVLSSIIIIAESVLFLLKLIGFAAAVNLTIYYLLNRFVNELERQMFPTWDDYMNAEIEEN